MLAFPLDPFKLTESNPWGSFKEFISPFQLIITDFKARYSVRWEYARSGLYMTLETTSSTKPKKTPRSTTLKHIKQNIAKSGAMNLPRFLFACFHNNLDISSVQIFLISSDILCRVHVSSGFLFLNQISNLVFASPTCAVKPISDVLILFL